LARLKNEDDADDAVVDTLIRFLNRKDRDIRNHEAWLIRAASYSCLNVMERRARRLAHEVTGDETGSEELLTADLPDVHGADPEGVAVARDLLKAMLNELTPREQAVISHLLEGSTMGEIASDLGVSEAHARVIVMRARQRLRAFLQK
jgi:RNA polymerase sigma factor (sigma-70 family)